MRGFISLALSMALAGGVCAAQSQPPSGASTKTTAKKRASKAASTDAVAARLDALQQEVDSQREAMRQLIQQVQSRNDEIHQLTQRLDQSQAAAAQAQAKAEAATTQAGQQEADVTALKSDVSDLKSNSAGIALSLQDTQKNLQASIDNPMAVHYKGVTITPGGFLAAETVYRQHGLGSDINTPFNSIPFNGASQSNLSEFYGSGRQSRISMLSEGTLANAKLSGYLEADFLSAGITSNNNQSNSYSLRQRQVWAQAALNSGWTFTGGQMWSLVTETKKGMDNRSEAVPLTIDPQYNVGFSWARQYGFRVTKNIDNKLWLGVSVENPQTTLGGHGASTNFVLGEQGSSGGLYNPTSNYAFNATPDFIFKIAAEPGWGHYEVFGILSDFRDRIFPCAATSVTTICGGTTGPSTFGVYNNSELAGGVGVNLRGTLAKQFDVGLHFLGGRGIGRYGTGGLPDAIARPDGVLVPLRTYQTLGTLEFHAKKLDIYTNVGSEYAGREWYNGGNIGYGSPLANNSGCGTETIPTLTSTPVQTPPLTGVIPGTGSIPVVGTTGTPLSGGFNPGALKNCTGDTRNLLEGTIGFWYRFYSGPKGRIQWGPQYSYVVRDVWHGSSTGIGIPGSDPSAKEGMIFTSFRYYLP